MQAKRLAEERVVAIDEVRALLNRADRFQFDKALNAYSDDAKLDSAQAWDAWLREKMAKKE